MLREASVSLAEQFIGCVWLLPDAAAVFTSTSPVSCLNRQSCSENCSSSQVTVSWTWYSSLFPLITSSVAQTWTLSHQLLCFISDFISSVCSLLIFVFKDTHTKNTGVLPVLIMMSCHCQALQVFSGSLSISSFALYQWSERERESISCIFHDLVDFLWLWWKCFVHS